MSEVVTTVTVELRGEVSSMDTSAVTASVPLHTENASTYTSEAIFVPGAEAEVVSIFEWFIKFITDLF